MPILSFLIPPFFVLVLVSAVMTLVVLMLIVHTSRQSIRRVLFLFFCFTPPGEGNVLVFCHLLIETEAGVSFFVCRDFLFVIFSRWWYCRCYYCF